MHRIGLARLREVVPEAVRLTVLADRGFGDQKLYALLEELKFDYAGVGFLGEFGPPARGATGRTAPQRGTARRTFCDRPVTTFLYWSMRCLASRSMSLGVFCNSFHLRFLPLPKSQVPAVQ